ncbi:putative transmembrane protein 244 isoform X2 [Chiloscyllium punctatum]|uniref:putative transmembrane protein 244 isoform X2 n=1 Tax=Chiloscyllium punctatum TaxID=137246 RepID=UPI003B63D10C
MERNEHGTLPRLFEIDVIFTWPSKAKPQALRLNSFDGLIPFDFKTQAAKSNSKYLVNLLSMELTYFTSGILFAIIVKKWVWDYSITVTLIHVILSSAVMTEFPLAWQWWLALGGGLLMMICNGQLVAHCVCQNNPAYSSSNL